MLKDNFYSILSLLPDNRKDAPGSDILAYAARIKLHKNHPVYQGHFPGNPVVPGVCQIQIIREIFSEIIFKDFSLVSSDNIKFLNMIVPEKSPVLDVRISYNRHPEGGWQVSGTLSEEDVTFLKFKGIFIEQ